METQTFRSGFITIIGAPNAGKSTLMNRIVGQKVSVVSHRAQTTRNKIMGVYHGDGCQIIFIDTPGVTMPKNKLGEYMVKVAYDAVNEVDAILYIVDSENGLREKDEAVLERLKSAKAPVFAAINKIDISSMRAVDEIRGKLSGYSFIKEIIPISATEGDGVTGLLDMLIKQLPEGPEYFPSDMVTDMPERFICAEMIREKALIFLSEEIPHGIGVDIEKIAPHDGREDMLDIYAVIYCERESHKGIIIGKAGSMLKKIGMNARHDMEWLMGARINLQLHVKVKPDWRNSGSMLRELGYDLNN